MIMLISTKLQIEALRYIQTENNFNSPMSENNYASPTFANNVNGYHQRSKMLDDNTKSLKYP
jgi:hypothetical protein